VSTTRTPAGLLALVLLGLPACGGPFRTLTHATKLPSGAVVQVMSCDLVWGVEHDERHASDDAFQIEYVSQVPMTRTQELDREAREVFELIRPVSEQWNLPTATVSAFRRAERRGHYDVYLWKRAPSGEWTFQRTPMKVHNTDSDD
jgi:hypothetical protein